MTNKKISALTAATTPLAGTELAPIVQSGATVSVSAENIAKSTQPGSTAGTIPYLNASKVPTNGTQLQFDGSNIGINVTPATNDAISKSLQIGSQTLLSDITGDTHLSNNAVYNSGWKRITANVVSNYYQSGGIHVWRTAATGAANSTITWTQAMALDVSSNLTLNVNNLIMGTAAKGINFTANTHATGMTSKLLNDYEEGTWTPTLTCGTSGTITLNSGFAGTYTKVGRQVTVCVTVYADSVSVPVGSLRLNGLPFTCNSGNSFGSGAAIHGQTTLVPAGSSLDARVIAGEAAISIYAFTAGTVVNAASYVQATTLFTITCSYFV